MIERVLDENSANKCDVLLTKLIKDEMQYDKTISDNTIVKDYFKNIIKEKENILLCYIEDNNIVGYIYLKPLTNNNSKGYLIDGLYVEENYRNKGIGKKLMSYALNECNKYDIEFIDINVLYNNEIAKKLYNKCGFIEHKITMRKDLKS